MWHTACVITPRVWLQMLVLNILFVTPLLTCAMLRSMQYAPPLKQQAPVPDGTVGTTPSDLAVKMADTPADPATNGQVCIALRH
jgi:hypothetical protein